MTEAKKTETKKEEAPAKMTTGQMLREKRGLLGVLRKDIETQAAILKNKYNEDMAATLAERQKGVRALKDEVEVEKVKHKEVYDVAKKLALEEYDASLAAITKKRDQLISDAHGLKEGEYQRLNQKLAKESEPFITKHREESADITKKYEKEAAEHHQAGEKAVADLQEEIKALELELSKKAEKYKESQAAKKPTEATT